MNNQANEFLTRLYEEKYDILLNMAKARLDNNELAEELVQETFLTAQANIDKVLQHMNPGGWLYKTLDNLMRKEWSSRVKYIELQKVLSKEFADELRISENEINR